MITLHPVGFAEHSKISRKFEIKDYNVIKTCVATAIIITRVTIFECLD